MTKLKESRTPRTFARAGRLFLGSQRITAELLAVIQTLAATTYAELAESQPVLADLTATVVAASSASTHLAIAVAADPLDGAGVPGPPSEAVTDLQDALAEAVHCLDVASANCAHAAFAVARSSSRDLAAEPLASHSAAPASLPATAEISTHRGR
ncbi:hypothetical protein [Streptomyces sp. NPDC048577]|uniref:hypothetical protein n=1 Tax=Streptomyces sp. NPDC048577 TaxID=3157209 RepID=UPI003442C519